jgi:hypothetical protein
MPAMPATSYAAIFHVACVRSICRVSSRNVENGVAHGVDEKVGDAHDPHRAVQKDIPHDKLPKARFLGDVVGNGRFALPRVLFDGRQAERLRRVPQAHHQEHRSRGGDGGRNQQPVAPTAELRDQVPAQHHGQCGPDGM